MSTPQFIDVHTHAHFAAFKDDSEEVIERALDADVWMINVGTQRDTSRGAVQSGERYQEGVYAAVGLHPIHTEKSYHDQKELGSHLLQVKPVADGGGFNSRAEEFDYDYYRKLAVHPKCVAIGECGLDYYRLSEDTKARQFEAFEQQIALAAEVKKPLMIHCRNAFTDLIDILRSTSNQQPVTSNQRGVVHFFTGSIADARALLDLGFSFSFGGVVTFARDYDQQLRYIPLDRIVSETDAPYVTPVPFRGKRNEPVYVREVVKTIAEIKGEDYAKVRAQLAANAVEIFRLGALAGK
jgi:TatD DNase family protein